MKQVFLLWAFTLFAFHSFGQKSSKKLTTSENQCRGSWQYFSLQDTIKGKVLFHAKANVLCGGIATASLTVIKTTLGDTIRVLEICNVDKDFDKYTMVNNCSSSTTNI